VGSLATGDGGDIDLSARNLSVTDGAEISARTFGSGNAGSVTIAASGQVTVGERAAISATGQTGKGGSISVDAGSVDVLDGGQILASTEGTGNSGDISVTADQVTVSGRSGVGARAAITAITTLLASSGSGGNSGAVDIRADDVLVSDGGLVTTQSLGSGAPKPITIEAGSSLRIDGGELRSVAESPTADVTGGDIVLTSDGDIALQNQAVVNAQALGAGDAGSSAGSPSRSPT
jgi:large exoprotein involved in heme utilization and adhesion